METTNDGEGQRSATPRADEAGKPRLTFGSHFGLPWSPDVEQLQLDEEAATANKGEQLMDRLIAPNSVPFASADTAPATGTAQYATSGNPVTGTPATVLPAYAWNMLQDEIYNVIIAAGLTPNRNEWNQLLTAIETMLQGSTTNVGIDTGAANAYVVAFTPALPNPVPWVPFWFKVKTTNTGASTLNATGTVEPLVGGAHLALQGGELVANGDALVYWNPTLASGAGSYVLMFCSGAAEQIAPSTQSSQAVNQSQVIGVGQNLTNETVNRAASTVYTNSTGKPIFVYIGASITGSNGSLSISVGAAPATLSYQTGAGNGLSGCALVPAGATYELGLVSAVISNWYELR